jgi:preflagellin peptidase FlaK
VFVSVPDLLRIIVVPIFAWAAYRDIRTRRIPNWVWLPLVTVGIIALAMDAWSVLTFSAYQPLFFVRVVVSLGLVAPLGYAFWRLGGCGGADAKAIMTLALLFPTYPVLYLPQIALPLERTTLGVFSLTVLTNTVLVGMVVPIGLACRNAVNSRYTSTMFIGRPVTVSEIPNVYGRLLGRDGNERITSRGLDIDALRMYLHWRGTTLASVCSAPTAHRDPARAMTPNESSDGSFAHSSDSSAGTLSTPPRSVSASPDGSEDPWGAATFLGEIDGDAYGTTPDQLREGLEMLCSSESESESVWITPGIPFLVPVFLGLVIAFTYGDILYTMLRMTGIG